MLQRSQILRAKRDQLLSLSNISRNAQIIYRYNMMPISQQYNIRTNSSMIEDYLKYQRQITKKQPTLLLRNAERFFSTSSNQPDEEYVQEESEVDQVNEGQEIEELEKREKVKLDVIGFLNDTFRFKRSQDIKHKLEDINTYLQEKLTELFNVTPLVDAAQSPLRLQIENALDLYFYLLSNEVNRDVSYAYEQKQQLRQIFMIQNRYFSLAQKAKFEPSFSLLKNVANFYRSISKYKGIYFEPHSFKLMYLKSVHQVLQGSKTFIKEKKESGLTEEEIDEALKEKYTYNFNIQNIVRIASSLAQDFNRTAVLDHVYDYCLKEIEKNKDIQNEDNLFADEDIYDEQQYVDEQTYEVQQNRQKREQRQQQQLQSFMVHLIDLLTQSEQKMIANQRVILAMSQYVTLPSLAQHMTSRDYVNLVKALSKNLISFEISVAGVVQQEQFGKVLQTCLKQLNQGIDQLEEQHVIQLIGALPTFAHYLPKLLYNWQQSAKTGRSFGGVQIGQLTTGIQKLYWEINSQVYDLAKEHTDLTSANFLFMYLKNLNELNLIYSNNLPHSQNSRQFIGKVNLSKQKQSELWEIFHEKLQKQEQERGNQFYITRPNDVLALLQIQKLMKKDNPELHSLLSSKFLQPILNEKAATYPANIINSLYPHLTRDLQNEQIIELEEKMIDQFAQFEQKTTKLNKIFCQMLITERFKTRTLKKQDQYKDNSKVQNLSYQIDEYIKTVQQRLEDVDYSKVNSGDLFDMYTFYNNVGTVSQQSMDIMQNIMMNHLIPNVLQKYGQNMFVRVIETFLENIGKSRKFIIAQSEKEEELINQEQAEEVTEGENSIPIEEITKGENIEQFEQIEEVTEEVNTEPIEQMQEEAETPSEPTQIKTMESYAFTKYLFNQTVKPVLQGNRTNLTLLIRMLGAQQNRYNPIDSRPIWHRQYQTLFSLLSTYCKEQEQQEATDKNQSILSFQNQHIQKAILDFLQYLQGSYIVHKTQDNYKRLIYPLLNECKKLLEVYENQHIQNIDKHLNNAIATNHALKQISDFDISQNSRSIQAQIIQIYKQQLHPFIDELNISQLKTQRTWLQAYKVLNVIEKDLGIGETEETRKLRKMILEPYNYDRQITLFQKLNRDSKLNCLKEIKDINSQCHKYNFSINRKNIKAQQSQEQTEEDQQVDENEGVEVEEIQRLNVLNDLQFQNIADEVVQALLKQVNKIQMTNTEQRNYLIPQTQETIALVCEAGDLLPNGMIQNSLLHQQKEANVENVQKLQNILIELHKLCNAPTLLNILQERLDQRSYFFGKKFLNREIILSFFRAQSKDELIQKFKPAQYIQLVNLIRDNNVQGFYAKQCYEQLIPVFREKINEPEMTCDILVNLSYTMAKNSKQLDNSEFLKDIWKKVQEQGQKLLTQSSSSDSSESNESSSDDQTDSTSKADSVLDPMIYQMRRSITELFNTALLQGNQDNDFVLEIVEASDLIKAIHQNESFTDLILTRKGIYWQIETVTNILNSGLLQSHESTFQPIVQALLEPLQSETSKITNQKINVKGHQLNVLRRLIENPQNDFEKEMSQKFADDPKEFIFKRTGYVSNQESENTEKEVEEEQQEEKEPQEEEAQQV